VKRAGSKPRSKTQQEATPRFLPPQPGRDLTTSKGENVGPSASRSREAATTTAFLSFQYRGCLSSHVLRRALCRYSLVCAHVAPRLPSARRIGMSSVVSEHRIERRTSLVQRPVPQLPPPTPKQYQSIACAHLPYHQQARFALSKGAHLYPPTTVTFQLPIPTTRMPIMEAGPGPQELLCRRALLQPFQFQAAKFLCLYNQLRNAGACTSEPFGRVGRLPM
jgi:hypothetical protein